MFGNLQPHRLPSDLSLNSPKENAWRERVGQAVSRLAHNATLLPDVDAASRAPSEMPPVGLGALRNDAAARGLKQGDVLARAGAAERGLVVVRQGAAKRTEEAATHGLSGRWGEWAHLAAPVAAPGRGALAGWSVGVKDNLHVAGMPTRCGSRVFDARPFYAPEDAEVVARLRRAGAQVLGKTSMDEFGMGASGELSFFGHVANPRDPRRVSGGSSSGSAAAVAGGSVRFALGSDTGGSVRLPAAYCGVFGLKPSYGAFSRRGLVAFASSLDCVGVLASSGEDLRAVFEVLRGKDPRDATSRTWPRPDKTRLRVGVDETAWQHASPELQRERDAALALLGDSVEIVPGISGPSPKANLGAYGVLSSVEAWSNLARFDGSRFGDDGAVCFGPEVQARLAFGRSVLDGAYGDALGNAEAQRRTVRKWAVGCFSQVDVLLGPAAPGVAPLRGEAAAEDPDMLLVAANLAGYPGLTVPSGNLDGVGLHLSAPWGREEWLFQVAGALEGIA